MVFNLGLGEKQGLIVPAFLFFTENVRYLFPYHLPMKYLLSALLLLLLFSCNKTEKKEPPFDSFVYSFSTLHLNYSVKFTNSDTVYFLKRFPKPETTSYAIMNDAQRSNIVALIKKIDFSKYKSEYIQENIVDAVQLRFDVTKNNKSKSIDIYGDIAPEALYVYPTEFNDFIKHLNFQPYTHKIDFGNVKHFESPELPINPAPKATN